MRLQFQRFDQAGKARVGFEEVVAGAWAGLRRGTGNGEAASSRGASVMDAGSRPDGSASFGWICVYISSASIRRERRTSGSKKWLPRVHGQGYVEMPGAEDLDCLAGGCADGRKVGTGEFLAVVQRWMREADLMDRLR